MSSSIYYVYLHTDPRTEELLYVGHGCRGRAWIHGSRRTCLRSQKHLDHLEDMAHDGYLPSEWVSIALKGVSKSVACKHEQELIRDLSPTYNKPQGKQLLKVTPVSFKRMTTLRDTGYSYSQIAEEVGLSTMTVFRALNNRTKNIGENFD